MTKSELIEKVSSAAGLSKADTEKALQTVFESISKALKKGEKVTLVGFGTFDVGERKARQGRNPRTGEKIKIPAMKSPRFKAGKALKDAVNL